MREERQCRRGKGLPQLIRLLMENADLADFTPACRQVSMALRTESLYLGGIKEINAYKSVVLPLWWFGRVATANSYPRSKIPFATDFCNAR
jgi:hypothetical protein